jgi:G3E family GTPase
VVIETSGLADPAPVAQAFLSEPTLAGLFRVGTVIATVDAVNGPGTLDRHEESVRQAALADHILITKLDLIAPTEQEATEAALMARLHRINPAAKIVRIDDPALDWSGS